jgi:hypothetical protein
MTLTISFERPILAINRANADQIISKLQTAGFAYVPGSQRGNERSVTLSFVRL